VTLIAREGYVSGEFIDLARKERRTDDENRRLDHLKLEMADRVMAARAEDVYDVTGPPLSSEPEPGPGQHRRTT